VREELQSRIASLNSDELSDQTGLKYIRKCLDELSTSFTSHQQSLINASLSEMFLSSCIGSIYSFYFMLQGHVVNTISSASVEVAGLVNKSGSSHPALRFMFTFAEKLREIQSTLQSANISDSFLRRFTSSLIEALVHSANQHPQNDLYLESLPSQLQVVLATVIQVATAYADSGIPPNLLRRMKRDDLIQMNMPSNHSFRQNFDRNQHQQVDSDGLNALVEDSKDRFPDDERLNETIRFLRSSAPAYLKVDRGAEVSDLEYRRKLQLVLLLLCRRALSFPVGRGMLTIGSQIPTAAEPWHFPPLVLSGKLASTNSIVILDTSVAPPELTLWPEFHNGIASSQFIYIVILLFTCYHLNVFLAVRSCIWLADMAFRSLDDENWSQDERNRRIAKLDYLQPHRLLCFERRVESCR
jgi:hypothetical protein